MKITFGRIENNWINNSLRLLTLFFGFKLLSLFWLFVSFSYAVNDPIENEYFEDSIPYLLIGLFFLLILFVILNEFSLRNFSSRNTSIAIASKTIIFLQITAVLLITLAGLGQSLGQIGSKIWYFSLPIFLITTLGFIFKLKKKDKTCQQL